MEGHRLAVARGGDAKGMGMAGAGQPGQDAVAGDLERDQHRGEEPLPGLLLAQDRLVELAFERHKERVRTRYTRAPE